VGSDGGVAAGALAGNIATLRPRVERPLELRNRLLIRCAHNRASIQYVSFWHFSEVVRLTAMSVHGAKAEVSFERPEVR
jgi:hypothetical protein